MSSTWPSSTTTPMLAPDPGSDLWCTSLGEDAFALVLPASHRLARKRRPRPESPRTRRAIGPRRAVARSPTRRSRCFATAAAGSGVSDCVTLPTLDGRHECGTPNSIAYLRQLGTGRRVKMCKYRRIDRGLLTRHCGTRARDDARRTTGGRPMPRAPPREWRPRPGTQWVTDSAGTCRSLPRAVATGFAALAAALGVWRPSAA